MNLQIRECLPRDLEHVASLWARSSPASIDDEIRDQLLWLNELHPRLCLVGEVNDVIVAAVAAAYDGFVGRIHHLAMAPEFQRLGYERPLLDELERRLTNLGCRKLIIRIPTNNRGALGFYFAHGYDFEKVISIAKTLSSDNDDSLPPKDRPPLAFLTNGQSRPASHFKKPAYAFPRNP